MGDVIDMRRFRGLRHRMPTPAGRSRSAAWPWPGIFPLAGFFSKDEILLALKSASTPGATAGARADLRWIYWVAIVTAFLTAFYTGRAFFMTFWGPEKLPSPDDPEAPDRAGGHRGHAHDALVMATTTGTASTTSATSRRRS